MSDNVREAIRVHKKAWAALKILGPGTADDVLSEARATARDALRILVRIPPRDNRDATERLNYLTDYYGDFLSRIYHEQQCGGPQRQSASTAPEPACEESN